MSVYRTIGPLVRRPIVANYVVGGPIWSELELIQEITFVRFTCKFKKDRFNGNRETVKTSMCLTLEGSYLYSQWWVVSAIRTHTSFISFSLLFIIAYPYWMQV